MDGAKFKRLYNTSSLVDHDRVIEDFDYVAVGAHICESVKVGQNAWIGADAIVSNNVSSRSNILGAGTVVVKDITEDGIYIGVPAKKIMKNNAESFKNGPSKHIRGGYYVSRMQAIRIKKSWRVA